MKNLIYALLFIIASSQFVFSNDEINQNISKLNNLYLNGVLNKESYFSSLNKLGLDTNNEIFSNLFDLFENNTIDLKNYEKSILNLLKVSTPIVEKSNNHSKILQYEIVKCSGDQGACMPFKERSPIEVEIDQGKLKFTENYKSKLLSHPSIVSIQKEDFKLNDNKAQLSMYLTNVGGIVFKLQIDGQFESNNFMTSQFKAFANGQSIVSGTLLKIN